MVVGLSLGDVRSAWLETVVVGPVVVTPKCAVGLIETIIADAATRVSTWSIFITLLLLSGDVRGSPAFSQKP
jgi:hypothetical protein